MTANLNHAIFISVFRDPEVGREGAVSVGGTVELKQLITSRGLEIQGGTRTLWLRAVGQALTALTPVQLAPLKPAAP